MPKAALFSQLTGMNVGLGSNPENPCPSAKKIPHAKHGGQYGLPLHPLLTDDEINFILSAPMMELRSRYNPEANSHRNRKNKAKANFSPELSDLRDFLLYVGPMPQPGMTLDRINNDDPQYAWNKVRWATKKVQNNNKSDTGTYTCSTTGNTVTTSELAQRQGVGLDTIRKRRKRNWTDDEIIAGYRFSPGSVAPKPKFQGYTPASQKNVQADFVAFSVGPLWGYARLDFPAGLYNAHQRHRICHPTMSDYRFSNEARSHQWYRQYGDGEYIPGTKKELIQCLSEDGDGFILAGLVDDGVERHFVKLITRNPHLYFPNFLEHHLEVLRDQAPEWIENMEQRFRTLAVQDEATAKDIGSLKHQL
ncbi:hypothetical protein [Mesorhizobium sp. WSM3626]|uniref:hypothetical protein n=1 Tax=Mesorhizobium sp. WSM3626 TaxID=1040987 RepID=UPI0012EBC06F|nr:hypothetical protein [Mesorhizobium sp. WSM3626]